MNFIEYVKQIWKNGPSGGTPWSAARLNHMEDGIANNNSMISELNNNIIVRDINNFTYLGVNFTIYKKNGILYVKTSGKLTDVFPTNWTQIATISIKNYGCYGHLITNSTGTVIRISCDTNGIIMAYAINKCQNNEYLQDSCAMA